MRMHMNTANLKACWCGILVLMSPTWVFCTNKTLLFKFIPSRFPIQEERTQIPSTFSMGAVSFHPRKCILPRQACFLSLAPEPPPLLFEAWFPFLTLSVSGGFSLWNPFLAACRQSSPPLTPVFLQFWENDVCDDLVTAMACSACPPPRRPSSLEASRVVRYTWAVTRNACVFWPAMEQESLSQGRHWAHQVCGFSG